MAREWGVPGGTPTVKAPGGGKHFYLRGSGPSKVGFQPGVDLRGRGGHAVGAGARRSDGVYEWEVAPWEVDEAAIPSSSTASSERFFAPARPSGSPRSSLRASATTPSCGRAPPFAARASQPTVSPQRSTPRTQLAAVRCSTRRRSSGSPRAARDVRAALLGVLDPWKYSEDERPSQRARLVLLASYPPRFGRRHGAWGHVARNEERPLGTASRAPPANSSASRSSRSFEHRRWPTSTSSPSLLLPEGC
jgi:hypothetical protein